MSSAVIIYTFSFAHHGKYSSYARLTHYLSDQRVLDATWRSVERLPTPFSRRLLHRWLRSNEYRLRKYLRSETLRCIHYIYPENALYQGWRWKRNHKFILTVHQPRDYLERMFREPANEGFFKGLKVADAVVAPDPETLEAHRPYAPRARLEIIPHGVDVQFFQCLADSTHRPMILTIGNWLRDYDCWAKVVRLLLARMPAIQFEVIAAPNTIRKARAALGAGSAAIHYSSGISDEELRAAYARAQIMFLPLQGSGANNAVLESLAMGLPLVITDLPATRFYIGPEAGRYFHNADIEGCVALLAGLISDASQRQLMSAAAHARAAAEFDWRLIADRYRALYRTVPDQGG